VAGTDVDVELVRHRGSFRPGRSTTCEAERAGILNAHGRGTVPRFVHDLMREGVQDQLAASELAAIHLAIAEELERRGGHEAAIAHHRLAALPVGAPRSAIEATLAGARAAMTRLAFEDAARLFDRGSGVECGVDAVGGRAVRGAHRQGRRSTTHSTSKRRSTCAPGRRRWQAIG
jgi:hypothetical protein